MMKLWRITYVCKFNKNNENQFKNKKNDFYAKALTLSLVLPMLIFGIYGIVRRSNEEETTKSSSHAYRVGRTYGDVGTTAPSCYFRPEGCEVVCSNLDMEQDSDRMIEKLREAKSSCKTCQLTLNNPTFLRNTIHDAWLNGTDSALPEITKMTLSGSEIADIGRKSFQTFKNLEVLTITDTSISYLKQDTFNISTLKDLELRNNAQLIAVDYGLLHGTPKLCTFQVQGVRAVQDEQLTELLVNFTGNKTMNNIDIIDWRFNSFRTVSRRLLRNAPNVESVYLTDNEIRDVENGTFDGLKQLKQVNLNKNKIKIAPEYIFSRMVHTTRVYFNDNQFDCTCDMKWLKDFVIVNQNGTYTDVDQILCDSPEDYEGKKFLQVDFCPSENMTTTTEQYSSTTQTTSSTHDTTVTTISIEPPLDSETKPCDDTTSHPPLEPNDPMEDINIECDAFGIQPKEKYFRYPLQPSYFYLTSQNTSKGVITLAKGHAFTITEPDEGNVTIIFNDNQIEGRSILWLGEWFNMMKTNRHSYKCIANLTTDSHVFSDMEPETTYTFCVFTIPSVINLLDCVPYTTKPLRENQVWLTQGKKTLMTIISAIIVFIAFIIGAAILYLLVRKNPTLIRGSKRVVIVKKQERSQALVLPKYYTEESLSSSTTTLYSREPSSSSQSFILEDDEFSTVSYISAIQPTPVEIFQYRLERLQARSKDQKLAEERSIPPSLPPCTKQHTDINNVLENGTKTSDSKQLPMEELLNENIVIDYL